MGEFVLNKYILLSSLSLAAAVSVFAAGKWYQASIPRVEYTEARAVSVEDYVSCIGRLERVGTKSVYPSQPGIATSVSVSPGDQVQAGQELARVQTLPEGMTQQSALEVYSSFLHSESGAENLLSMGETETLTAPISGTVVSVSLNPEEYAGTAQAAVIISNGNGLQLRLSVNESQVPDLREGQKAEITGSGFRDSSYLGTVTEISDEATQAVSGTSQETVVEVLVAVENPGADMKPGFSAKARIVTQEKEGVLIAPYETVGAEEDGSEYVFVCREGRAVKRPVETGEEYDSGFEILSGLEEGDTLLYSPESLTDGGRVILAGRAEVEP